MKNNLNKIKFSINILLDKIINTPIFCTVNNKNKEVQLNLSLKLINHWCTGAAPILIIRDVIIKNFIKIILYIKITDNKKKIEEIAWIKKYFKVLSDWYLFFFSIKKGIILIIFTSKKIHINNHLSTEIIIMEEKIIIKKKRILLGCNIMLKENKIIKGLWILQLILAYLL